MIFVFRFGRLPQILKNPLAGWGERVGEAWSDDDGQPVPPRIRVVIIVIIMVVPRAAAAMPFPAPAFANRICATFDILRNSPGPSEPDGGGFRPFK